MARHGSPPPPPVARDNVGPLHGLLRRRRGIVNVLQPGGMSSSCCRRARPTDWSRPAGDGGVVNAMTAPEFCPDSALASAPTLTLLPRERRVGRHFHSVRNKRRSQQPIEPYQVNDSRFTLATCYPQNMKRDRKCSDFSLGMLQSLPLGVCRFVDPGVFTALFCLVAWCRRYTHRGRDFSESCPMTRYRLGLDSLITGTAKGPPLLPNQNTARQPCKHGMNEDSPSFGYLDLQAGGLLCVGML